MIFKIFGTPALVHIFTTPTACLVFSNPHPFLMWTSLLDEPQEIKDASKSNSVSKTTVAYSQKLDNMFQRKPNKRKMSVSQIHFYQPILSPFYDNENSIPIRFHLKLIVPSHLIITNKRLFFIQILYWLDEQSNQ